MLEISRSYSHSSRIHWEFLAHHNHNFVEVNVSLAVVWTMTTIKRQRVVFIVVILDKIMSISNATYRDVGKTWSFGRILVSTWLLNTSINQVVQWFESKFLDISREKMVFSRLVSLLYDVLCTNELMWTVCFFCLRSLVVARSMLSLEANRSDWK